MAITKIHAIKSTLGKALAYIENPDKTDGQMLVSGYNCEPQTASIDFEMTAVLAHKARNLQRKRSTNLAYHLIQSFSPEDPHISAIDWAISVCQSCCMGVFSFYFSRSKSSFYYLYDSDATSVSSSHGA